VGRIFGQAILNTRLAQPVTFLTAVRQVKVHLPAELAKNFGQNGSGRDAVHVIISENDDAFAPFTGRIEPVHGSPHIREEERIRQVFEARLKELKNGIRLGEATIEKALGEQFRNPEFPGQG
jgi:hypothetical protein